MGLSAENRLRRPAEFRQVLGAARRSGGNRYAQRAGDRLLLVSAIPNGRPVTRIGLAVGKRVGGSVVRNRVKRRLREIFRELAAVEMCEDEEGWDVVATARPEAAEATYEELRYSAKILISKIKARR